ncbi:FadR/GntR family transcriptional regulator [Dethiobacter alkaliphilus]|uniref:GntR domain protein n=1 Tax=Dethiobacter alkaliphilus AHT 1 TaxID=555088 RepID=C0GH87_DETAL|nr:FadR/GntR family transcriptional regulator [Dethiobacter alkaliphilus]EEG77389.1 GntR domain protein [Dethiobacter alkaliphilus AHT 1]
MFKPIKQKRVYEEVLEQIKNLVKQGVLKPGDRLISERELAEQLQVSRASIREAFSALDMMGILESKPGEGTFIRQEPLDSMIKPLALMMTLYQNNSLEVLEIRAILEAGSAALAARRVTPEGLDKIKAALDEMEQDVLSGAIGELPDAAFHLAVVEAADNQVLLRLMNTVSDLIVETMRHSREKLFETPGNKLKLLQQHKEIYRAIAERDSEEAREAMRAHLRFVRKEITTYEEEREENSI